MTNTRSPWLTGCLLLIGLGSATLLLLLVAASLARRDRSPASLFNAGRVGQIDLLGPIEESTEFVEELRRHQDDPSERALVVRIDSPGGGVAPSQEMYSALRDYAESTNRPVIASVSNVAASGGYYVACGADRILANPGSLTGSIGVIWSFADASKLMEKIGVRVEVVKTGAMKDAGAYWRALTPDERATMERTLDDVKLQFAETVAESRHLPLERVLALADGRVFSGREAQGHGLVDSLGGLETALDMAAELGGVDRDAPVVTHRRIARDFWSWLSDPRSAVAQWIDPAPRLEYRFR